MCEVPSNLLQAEQLAARFDELVVGPEDLSQLLLGIDRTVPELCKLYRERGDALCAVLGTLVERAHRGGAAAGICGRIAVQHPRLSSALLEHGIDSITLDAKELERARDRLSECESLKVESPRRESLEKGTSLKKVSARDDRNKHVAAIIVGLALSVAMIALFASMLSAVSAGALLPMLLIAYLALAASPTWLALITERMG
jgi:phosphoenolpyruvate-protein kinase (PTS system EI component)